MDERQGEVSTLEQLKAFIVLVGSFHDGIIKEMHWVNNGFIAPDLGMRLTDTATARVLVQRQFRNPSAVELVFHGLKWLNLDNIGMVFESEASQSGKLLVFRIGASEFHFESMSYRFASVWMGEASRFGSFVPGRN